MFQSNKLTIINSDNLNTYNRNDDTEDEDVHIVPKENYWCSCIGSILKYVTWYRSGPAVAL